MAHRSKRPAGRPRGRRDGQMPPPFVCCRIRCRRVSAREAGDASRLLEDEAEGGSGSRDGIVVRLMTGKEVSKWAIV